MSSGEWVEINGLEVAAMIGVPETERENPQRLAIFLRFQIATPFASLNDRLKETIDYAEVASEVEKIVQSSQAHLIENLVRDIGDLLASEKISIEMMHTTTDRTQSTATIDVRVAIDDAAHLTRLLQRIRKVGSVLSVRRTG